MGMLWTNNGPKDRVKRLVTKAVGNPFFPLLAYSKLTEAVIAGGQTEVWAAASIVATGGYVIGEDLLEYVETNFDSLQDYFDTG